MQRYYKFIIILLFLWNVESFKILKGNTTIFQESQTYCQEHGGSLLNEQLISHVHYFLKHLDREITWLSANIINGTYRWADNNTIITKTKNIYLMKPVFGWNCVTAAFISLFNRVYITSETCNAKISTICLIPNKTYTTQPPFIGQSYVTYEIIHNKSIQQFSQYNTMSTFYINNTNTTTTNDSKTYSSLSFIFIIILISFMMKLN